MPGAVPYHSGPVALCRGGGCVQACSAKSGDGLKEAVAWIIATASEPPPPKPPGEPACMQYATSTQSVQHITHTLQQIIRQQRLAAVAAAAAAAEPL